MNLQKTLSILIPVYNEEKALPSVLPEIISFVNENDFNLVLVNDGSKDNSLGIMNEICIGESKCSVVNHKVNKGYGGAIKSGVNAAQTV